MDHYAEVKGLPLPPHLLSMMATGRWGHPGDDMIRTSPSTQASGLPRTTL